MKLTEAEKISALSLGGEILQIIKKHPTCEIYLNAKGSSLFLRYTPQGKRLTICDLNQAYVDEEILTD